MKSSSRNALRSFDRKNAPPLHCFSAGSGSVTRAPRASLIFWSSAVFWVPAKAPNHARFWSISMLPFSRHFALMTIEGLGKKFQEARRARNLTLDEAARMTKIRPARLAEIEADDFSQFPSLAYAKGFLLIYGKFLDVDVTPYLDAFEDSERVTVDGYSYLQEHERAKPVSAPVVPRRPVSTGGYRVSPMPLIVGIVVLVIGFLLMKLVLNVQRLAPGRGEPTAQVSPSASPVSPAPAQASPANVAAAPSVAATPNASGAPTIAPTAIAAASGKPGQPEVRRAKAVTREDLAKAQETANPSSAESGEQNRVAIRPLKR